MAKFILILVFFLHWQRVYGAVNPYTGNTKGSSPSANCGPYQTQSCDEYYIYGRSGNSSCGANQTLPCDELAALRTVITSFRLIPTMSISASYCQISSNLESDAAIRCNCSFKDDKGSLICHIIAINMMGKQLSGSVDIAISGLQYLQMLRVSNNQLIGSIPESLGNLTNLETLYLYNNQLDGTIPSSFQYLKSLKYLDLSNNYLNGPMTSLGNLQNLIALNLRFNFLNGQIPPSFGNLSSLATLNLYSNMLSGSIPDLGNLSQLSFLALDDNELNGSLPQGIGKLKNLKRLWLTSNHLTGGIPESYSQLTALLVFAVAGNDLSGSIPKYIASWKNLTYLILLGNNFEGNIPEEIFNLPSLQTLWVSGLRNPGFTFPKKANLENIYSLILRNCSINGSIPPYIANWSELTFLDLSFNNLIGEIPQFGPNLKKIFLASNKLNGTFPSWITHAKSGLSQLYDPLKIDLSLNNFTNVPDVNRENGTLSHLPNTIIIEPSSDYISRKGRECPAKYHSLSINCGGEAVKFDKQNYENDTAFSYFYESPQANWAYSFSGDYISPTINASGYIKNLTCGVSVPEAQLYVNARVAPVSLTYFAFCLPKGKYEVKLYFAETLFSKKEDHSIVGKRLFDVHIQEKPVLQDFNIKKEAEDANKNIMKSFIATVLDHKPLRIDFFWVGKGSLYNPPGQNGPLISAISITRAPRKLSAWEITAIAVACVIALFILLAFLWRMGWIGDRELHKTCIKIGTQSYTVKQIIHATQKFSPKTKIGDGRLGIVYEAQLQPDLTVAVKKLFPQSKTASETRAEIFALSELENQNLVKLLGCYSNRGLQLLIYEYMDNGSLEKVLFDPDRPLQLSWETRYSICERVALGLEFLHKKEPPIIHRNIKASNILLNENCEAKISDFGLAKLYEDDDPFILAKAGITRLRNVGSVIIMKN
ncbi:probable LRR receptor-like serine/threonine-protein kinase At1g53430 isoform X1 [Jatropha curcas]|uniref:probable LRR receptor-like serine/threonine-protein kinase At1g53430 isoform X1 n=1 Tax=Jatropha curcas TaxID=180498 RepID=UPI0018943FED|nr:probable LRR receptor-like serine/threonine-protein kinase At1g53430 isoform X1 [Jatropha curcas]